GGVNAHAILEEAPRESDARDNALEWDSEVVLLRGRSREDIRRRAEELNRYLASAPQAALADLAFSLNADGADSPLCLSIVAKSTEDLAGKLDLARERLAEPQRRQIKDRGGIFYFDEPMRRRGKVAFLYPGEGSPYVGMFADLCLRIPCVRKAFDQADRVSLAAGVKHVPSLYFFPLSDKRGDAQYTPELREFAHSRIGVLMGDLAMDGVVEGLGIAPDFVAGHSSGEWAAMAKAGVFRFEEMLKSVADLRRIDAMSVSGELPEAAMLAVGAARERVEGVAREIGGAVLVANDNCPNQTVFAGTPAEIGRLAQELKRRGIFCDALPFRCGYHTPMVEALTQPLRLYLGTLEIQPPQRALYSGATAQPFPSQAEQIIDLSAGSWARPVEFRRMILAMHADGARLFIEVGPRNILSAFVDDILRKQEHLAVPCNVAQRSGVSQLNRLVGLLAAEGVALNAGFLYERRRVRKLTFNVDTDFPRKAGKSLVEMPVRVFQMGVAQRPLAPRPETPTVAQPPASPWPDLAAAFAAPVGGFLAAGPGADVEEAMRGHLRTMDHFLGVQQAVMKRFFESAAPGDGRHAAPADPQAAQTPPDPQAAQAPPDLPEAGPSRQAQTAPATPSGTPLLDEIVTRDGDGLEARCVLDRHRAPYLEHHAFAHEVSDADPSLRPTMILPMTFGLEMMAEAAALLAPGASIVEIRNIRATQWVTVKQDKPTPVRLRAERRKSGETHAALHVDAAPGVPTEGRPSPAMEALFVFADRRPDPPAASADDLAPLPGERRPALSARAAYETRALFHGPLLQGVTAFEGICPAGVRGDLTALGREGLLRDNAAPRFVLDPVLLDAAGHFTGYWSIENLDRGKVVFPVGVARMRFYGPNPRAGETLRNRVQILKASRHRLRSNMTMTDTEGRLRILVEEWTNWRFYFPQGFTDFCAWPKKTDVFCVWAEAEALLGAGGAGPFASCCRIEKIVEDQELWADLWAWSVLSRRERDEYETK
ncbi:MAG: polyketide synthase dehydratase domain-containing protein, partial [Candidatus Sumerlaeota bacterium]|nr:polyketide synthase dehydratase domain-containing protein [Candidatus Sumerlaeota bacterium]